MNQGNFEDYNERESEQIHEVYQMYEEMMNLVKEGIKESEG